ncbi:hypothetical protein PsorP6_006393 [Peronosclerospora sorghi]|uniref:Uncharacterized protein n=1 Tax=Peronosclerospora sorghi TaxID=230839 RepID=A0ACC0W3C2_9STRA|nr:hypothetical protein PsorP6_006393 [Peronosclerospora sorghi]
MDADDEALLSYFLPDGIADESPPRNSARRSSWDRNATTHQSRGIMREGGSTLSSDSMASISDASPFGSGGPSIWSSNAFFRSDLRGERRVVSDLGGSRPSASHALDFATSRPSFSSSLSPGENDEDRWPAPRYQPRRILQHPPGLSCPPGFNDTQMRESRSSRSSPLGNPCDRVSPSVSKSQAHAFHSPASSRLTGSHRPHLSDDDQFGRPSVSKSQAHAFLSPTSSRVSGSHRPHLSDDDQFGRQVRSTLRSSTDFTPPEPLKSHFETNSRSEKLYESRQTFRTWESDGCSRARQFGIQETSTTRRSPRKTRKKPFENRTTMRTRTPERKVDPFHAYPPRSPNPPKQFEDERKPRVPLAMPERAVATETPRTSHSVFVTRGTRRNESEEKETVSSLNRREDPTVLSRNAPWKNIITRGKEKEREHSTPLVRRQVYREKQVKEHAIAPSVAEEKTARKASDSSSSSTSLDAVAVASSFVKEREGDTLSGTPRESDTSDGTRSEPEVTVETTVTEKDEKVEEKENESIENRVVDPPEPTETVVAPVDKKVEHEMQPGAEPLKSGADEVSDVEKSKRESSGSVPKAQQHTEKQKADKKKSTRKKQKRGTASSLPPGPPVPTSTDDAPTVFFTLKFAALVVQGVHLVFTGTRRGVQWIARKLDVEGLYATAACHADAMKTVLSSVAMVLLVHAVSWFLRVHRVAFRALGAHRHMSFCFAFLYGFPFLVHYVFPWAPPWAPVCLWYAFLVQVFCTNGSTAMVTSFRVILPLVFLIEGISYHSFLLDLNGAELLLTSFIISALKTSNLRSPIFFLSLATQCLLAVFLGAELLVQWLQLALALYSLHYMALDENEWMSMGEEDMVYCNPAAVRRAMADFNHHLTFSRAASTLNPKRLNRRALAYVRGQKLR